MIINIILSLVSNPEGVMSELNQVFRDLVALQADNLKTVTGEDCCVCHSSHVLEGNILNVLGIPLLESCV